MTVSVQLEDFDIQDAYASIQVDGKSGASVFFVGHVRDFSDTENTLHIQHYPGMTEGVLEKIEASAHDRWPLLKTAIIHRVGDLASSDRIVFVGVSAAHRKEAFDACEYIIDILKTQAPFWKKEGDRWVDAKAKDQDAADAWLKN